MADKVLWLIIQVTNESIVNAPNTDIYLYWQGRSKMFLELPLKGPYIWNIYGWHSDIKYTTQKNLPLYIYILIFTIYVLYVTPLWYDLVMMFWEESQIATVLSTKAWLAVTLSTRDPTSPAVLFLSVSPWASRASRVNGRQIRDKYHNVSNQAFYSNAIKTCKTIKHLEDL